MNNSKRERHYYNNSNHLFGSKSPKIKNKKKNIQNKLYQNFSSSFIKRKNKNTNLSSYKKIFDYKNNRSNSNSISSYNTKDTKISKNNEYVNKKLRNKTPKIKHKLNKQNKTKVKNKLKKGSSPYFNKKINSKQILTLSHSKKNNNNSTYFNKYKTKVKLTNYFLKNINNCGNIKKSEDLNKYSSFYKKINRVQNNKNNKKYQIKINPIINKIKKSKFLYNIGNNSYDKNTESKNKSKLKKTRIMTNLKNAKNVSKKLDERLGKILNKALYKKLQKIHMKTNQGNYTTRKNNSFSSENIFLNNNYNNFINFNYIDKNYNINNINLANRKDNLKTTRKSFHKISYKKINSGKVKQKKYNTELFDFLQSKLKSSNNMSTLQNKEEISLLELKKMNSYNNFSFNSISSKNIIKKILDFNNNILFNKKNYAKNIINKKNYKKNKEDDNKNKKRENQRNKDILLNDKLKNKSNTNISNIFNTSITATKDKSYYLSERENLSAYIKRYYKENGHYPKSDINFYKYGRLLGKGSFGKVNLALHIASGRLVAIKSFNKKKLTTMHSKQKIRTEIQILKKLRNNIYCTRIFDTFQTEKHILIVMEFICADLLEYIRKRGKLSEKISKIIFRQIAQGLKYMHKLNIVHRDIKLDNLLLDLSNTIKICDFGESKILNPPDKIMLDHCGTPAYIAPEVFMKNGYRGFGCDIWSLGVTLYFMLTGEYPFKGRNLEELKNNIFSKNLDKIEFISEEANDLLEKMLTINPEERISLDEILRHVWLKDIDILEMNNKDKIKIFTKNEKYILEKYNVSYLKNNTEDLIENFNNEYLNTIEDEEKMENTRSIILAPYNTAISYFDDSFDSNKEIYNEIKVENNICKYKGEVHISNIKYEMSNNDEFDNGVIKSGDNNSISSFSNYSELSHQLKNENFKEKNNNLSFDDKNKNHMGKKFCKEIIKEIENKIGYDRNYLIKCLKNEEVNYATATYYLMLKDKNESNDFK